jgi:ABC-type phosphate/phosphonate transport system substrate-binding protein
LVLPLFGPLPGAAAEKETNRPDLFRVGLVNSLFQDIPEPMVAASVQLFQVLMHTQTGLHGNLLLMPDPFRLGDELSQEGVQVGVFHGVEFAWARQKYPDLRPLVLAVNRDRHLRAFVFVRPECTATDFASLQGKTLALPRGSKGHCRLFVERQCQARGKEPQQFFAQLTKPSNVEDALDDVVDGAVEAAVVDGVSLDCYKRRKPGRFAKLKELHRSEVFPTAVVAYRPGAVDEPRLERFRAGMLSANQSPRGRQLLTLWRITGFEPIPADYESLLTAIGKSYPPPVAAKDGSSSPAQPGTPRTESTP